MIGAIAGDVIGSVYEHQYSKFTDDMVITVAIAYAVLEKVAYAEAMKHYGRKYPNAGYGVSFYRWLHAAESLPYNSWGTARR